MQQSYILRNIDSGKSHSIASTPCLIGRDSSCDIVLSDGHPSRRHARITRDGGHWLIEDLGSTNGTFVNNRRIRKPTTIAAGDVIKLGTETYYFLDAQQPEQTIVAHKLPSDSGSGSSVVSEEPPDSELTSIEQDFPLPPGWNSTDESADSAMQAAIDQRLKRISRERRDMPEAAVAFKLGDQAPVIYGVSARGMPRKWKIGRSSDCKLRFDSPTLSAHHADLVYADNQWKLVDAGSTNGLRSHGKLQREVSLQDSSRVHLGQVEMFFRVL